MKNIVILGCENSHANTFLNFIRSNERFSDINVLGVYSNDPEASAKLCEKFDVPVLENYDECVSTADGVIITARHGDEHKKFAMPYISRGVPMFIDKPITVSESDALSLMRLCREAGVKVTGGSSCIHCEMIGELKSLRESEELGAVLGGLVRAPISMENAYGGFFFYSQHLVEMMLEVYGRYPESVKAYVNGKKTTVVFRYKDFDTVGLFTDGIYTYYAMIACEKGNEGGEFPVNGQSSCFMTEFEGFVSLLRGGEQKISYDDFIAPVFVMNAINRSLSSGKEEVVRYEKV